MVGNDVAYRFWRRGRTRRKLANAKVICLGVALDARLLGVTYASLWKLSKDIFLVVRLCTSELCVIE